MAPCLILPIPKQNAAEKLGFSLGFPWIPAVAACTGRRGPGPVTASPKTFEILGNLSISRCAANGGARGQAEDRPWQPPGSCKSSCETLQKSLEIL